MKNRWKFAIAVLIICLLAIYPCFRLMDQKETYRLAHNGTQIVNGEEVAMRKDTTLVMDETYGAMEKKENIQIVQVPIYVDGETKLVLPKDYLVIYPFDGGKTYRINHFTEIYEKNHQFYLKDGNKEKLLDGCFLFDGTDTYIFLEETRITYGDVQLQVSPLSFVTAIYGQESGAYNYDTNVYSQIPAEIGTILADIGSGYTISMEMDCLQSEGNQQLLYGNPGDLQKLQ